MKYKHILNIVKEEFKANLYGAHGITHWLNVYRNTKILSSHYNIQSDVFELFSILHDSKRENDYKDKDHPIRAYNFTRKLISKKLIKLSKKEEKILLFAIKNHSITHPQGKMINNLIVKICLDSDRLDLIRVGINPDPQFLFTDYAKEICKWNLFNLI